MIYEKLIKYKDILFDSHAHVNTLSYEEEFVDVIKKAKENGVEHIFDISVDLNTSKKSLEVSQKYPKNVSSFIGLDPEIFIPDSSLFLGLEKDDKWFDFNYSLLRDFINQNPKYITGIGECGLDFYWIRKNKDDNEIDSATFKNSQEMQIRLFKMHLELAKETKLPLSIHSRGAEKECLDILSEYKGVYGIFHSFTGDYKTAQKIIDSGHGLGVNGIITFRNADDLRETYKKIVGKPSWDWQYEDFYKKGIFFETDSPYLSPEGKRGEINSPANVRIVYQEFLNLLKDE